MIHLLHTIRAELAEVHPAAPAIALAIVVGGLIYAWRKLHPVSFERIPKPIQSLPAVLLSALVAALSSGGDGWQPVLDAIAGAVLGLTSVGGHHALKLSPLPYLGGAFPAAGEDFAGRRDQIDALKELSRKSKAPPPLLLLALPLLIAGCPPSNPACSEADLAQIEASYQGELAGACYGFGEDCPDKPKIDAKYRRLREDWVRCSPPDHVEDAGQ